MGSGKMGHWVIGKTTVDREVILSAIMLYN